MRILFKHKEALSRLAKELKRTFPELSLQEARRLMAIVSGYRNEKELVNSLTDRRQTEFPIWNPEYLASFSSRIPENIDMNKLMGFCCAFLSARPEHPLMTEPLKHELSQISSGMIFVSGHRTTGVTTFLRHIVDFLKSLNKKIILVGFRPSHLTDEEFRDWSNMLETIEYPHENPVFFDAYSMNQISMTMNDIIENKEYIFITTQIPNLYKQADDLYRIFCYQGAPTSFVIRIKGEISDPNRHALLLWRNAPQKNLVFLGTPCGILGRKLSAIISGLTSGEIIYARPLRHKNRIISLALREIEGYQLTSKGQDSVKLRSNPYSISVRERDASKEYVDILLTIIERVDEYKEYLSRSGQNKRNRVWICERENGELDVELDMFH